MKTILLLLFVSSLSFSQNTQKDIFDQQSDREWNYYSYFSGKEAHIESYLDLSILSNLKNTIAKLIESLKSTTASDLALFYPGLNLDNSDDRLELISNLTAESDSIDILESWESFREVILTSRWNDADTGCDKNSPIGNLNCGRKTKGSYVLSTLTIEQLESISSLKEVIASDFDYIKNNPSIAVAPEIIRLYQFFYDYRSINGLFSSGNVKNNEILSDLDKMVRIETIRSTIIQLFASENGRLENSNFVEINLEDSNCYSADESVEINCQYEYVKDLFFTEGSYTNLEAKNLVFDSKTIKSLLDNYIELYRSENGIFVNEQRVQEDFTRVFYVLSSIYDIDIQSPELSSSTRRKLISFLKQCNVYLLNNPNTIGLQIAKSIEKLILTIEAII